MSAAERDVHRIGRIFLNDGIILMLAASLAPAPLPGEL